MRAKLSAATIEQLRRRIARKRAAHQAITRDLVRLEDALHEQLRRELDETRRDRAADRREPGSFQREVELDER